MLKIDREDLDIVNGEWFVGDYSERNIWHSAATSIFNQTESVRKCSLNVAIRFFECITHRHTSAHKLKCTKIVEAGSVIGMMMRVQYCVVVAYACSYHLLTK